MLATEVLWSTICYHFTETRIDSFIIEDENSGWTSVSAGRSSLVIDKGELMIPNPIGPGPQLPPTPFPTPSPFPEPFPDPITVPDPMPPHPDPLDPQPPVIME